MPITKDNPIVIPASEEKTYNVWWVENLSLDATDRKSTRLNSSHSQQSRMPSSA